MANTHETTAQTAHAEHDSGVFPPLDSATFPSQLFWLVVFFALLYTLLSRLVLPRLGGIITARKGLVDGDIARAQALKDETEAALKAYEKSLADARASANDIAKKTRDKASSEADAQQKKLDDSLSTKIKAAEAKITKAKAAALEAVHDIAAESAAEIVSQLTGASATPAAAAKAVAAVAKN